MRSQGRGQREYSRSVGGGEEGVQRGECEVIIRGSRVRRAGRAGTLQREVSPQEKTAEGRGQTAEGGRKPR